MRGNANYRLKSRFSIGFSIATRQKFQFLTVAKEEWFPGSERLAAFGELISPLRTRESSGQTEGSLL
jgi:hypothetical protein